MPQGTDRKERSFTVKFKEMSALRDKKIHFGAEREKESKQEWIRKQICFFKVKNSKGSLKNVKFAFGVFCVPALDS